MVKQKTRAIVLSPICRFISQIFRSVQWRKLHLSSLPNFVVLHIFGTISRVVYLLHCSLGIKENTTTTCHCLGIFFFRMCLRNKRRSNGSSFHHGRSTCSQLPIWSLLPRFTSSICGTLASKTLPYFPALASTSRERVVHTKQCIPKQQLANAKENITTNKKETFLLVPLLVWSEFLALKLLSLKDPFKTT